MCACSEEEPRQQVWQSVGLYAVKQNECESLFNHKETVCVPVTMTPFARPGAARTICCGKPEISTETSCYGERTSCSFTVSQELCIELPITFGAQVETGSISVQCDGVSNGSCNCSDEEMQDFLPKRPDSERAALLQSLNRI